MSLLTVLIIALISLIVSIVFAVFFKYVLASITSNFSTVESQQQVSELLISEMKLSLESFQTTIDELSTAKNLNSIETEQVVKQLEYRIGLLQSDVVTLQEQVKQSLEQPEDKLYSRAFKLAAKGADLEEIITECELPRAEAEMLLSMYKSNQS
jgi:hypothetical protein